MFTQKDDAMIEAMIQFGGSFVKSLGYALVHADPINYQKLERAFPEYFKEYVDMADKFIRNKSK